MTILNTIEMTAANNEAWIIVSLVLAVFGFVTIVICFGEGRDEYVGRACGLIVAVLAILSLVIAAKTSRQHQTGEIHLEVTLDDSVPARDIFEGYELIEQRGEIYVLKPLDGGEAE